MIIKGLAGLAAVIMLVSCELEGTARAAGLATTAGLLVIAILLQQRQR